MTTSALLDIQESDKVFKVIPPQAQFLKTHARFPAYVGGWGTGKSLSLIGKAMALSEEFPNNLGIIFRKEFTDLRDSTVKDFESYTGIKVNSSREVQLPNGSVIMFRHIEELNNIQNINLGWFGIEQAEELDTDDQFFTLFGRLRRKGIRHCGFVVANTNGHNWIWRLWKKRALLDIVAQLMNEKPGIFPGASSAADIVQLIEAETYDNAHNLEPTFLAGLEVMKVEKPRLYNRFVRNSWDEADVADVVIPSDWVYAAHQRKANEGSVVLGVDVARFGDDRTIILPIRGRKQLPYIPLEGMDTMKVADEVARIADEFGATGIYVDVIGIGAGVYDRLIQLNYDAYGVNAAEASKVIDRKTKKPKFKNLRSEMWWRARQALDPSVENNPAPFSLIPDRSFEEELSAPKYEISGGQIVVEDKAELKKKDRLGRSPDIADAFCLAVYGATVGGSSRPAAASVGGLTMHESGAGTSRRKADWM